MKRKLTTEAVVRTSDPRVSEGSADDWRAAPPADDAPGEIVDDTPDEENTTESD